MLNPLLNQLNKLVKQQVNLKCCEADFDEFDYDHLNQKLAKLTTTALQLHVDKNICWKPGREGPLNIEQEAVYKCICSLLG